MEVDGLLGGPGAAATAKPREKQQGASVARAAHSTKRRPCGLMRSGKRTAVSCAGTGVGGRWARLHGTEMRRMASSNERPRRLAALRLEICAFLELRGAVFAPTAACGLHCKLARCSSRARLTDVHLPRSDATCAQS
eukprot:2886497-Pleurochrysis_carterae.AAC.3